MSSKHHLNNLKNRYLLLRTAETLLFALAIAVITFSLSAWITTSFLLRSVTAIGAGLAVAIFQVLTLHLHRFSESRIATYLNQHYTQLEASTDLLLEPEQELSPLQKIQKTTISIRLQSMEKDIHLPHRLIPAVISFIAGMLLWLGVQHYPALAVSSSPAVASSSPAAGKTTETVTTAALSKISITITPPAYTHLSPTTTASPHLKIIEGSEIMWKLTFSGEAVDVAMVLSGKDTIRLKKEGQAYHYKKVVHEGGFYQLVWKDRQGDEHQTDYYPLEIINDELPHIMVQNLPQFIELQLTDRLVVDLKADLTDDFGLTDSRIIATVSKGSGESVKFREETLRFFQPAQISGRQVQAARSIDIVKLGLEPGDELYFYIEAFDNKLPVANKSRTETFFIALKDTTTYEMVEEEGLGVDLMPEYFRSQRQIIIDTEKLLEERKKKKIAKEDFNVKSNELGYDQKVLRLRYGQFMGEEFESGVGNEAHAADEEHEEDKDEDPVAKYAHKHDTENEHNLVDVKKGPEDKKENPIDAYTHKHDDTEEATFFTQSIKAKLRVALTLMWDAELQLRMYQPEVSLPYQYKILKLLKEISNDSRVYVHRTGFDPPPLKEEKRLSGDLTELKNTFNKNNGRSEALYPAIRQALTSIEVLLENKTTVIDGNAKTVLQKAGSELATVALQQPGRYLKSLSQLKALTNNELKADEIKSALTEVRLSFWKIVPQQAASPVARSSASHPLDARFLQQLHELKHER